MGYEIDFIAVGKGSTSPGDAIAVRFGNLYGQRNEQTVMVFDGGTETSAKDLVNHIKTNYKTYYVDIAINTHPDIDHVSGLTVILSELRVGQLAMHLPWNHSPVLQHLFEGRPFTQSPYPSQKNCLQSVLSVGIRLQKIYPKSRSMLSFVFCSVTGNPT